MDKKIEKMWLKVNEFCLTQTNNFYAGMALSVIMLFTLTSFLSNLWSMIACPFATAILYAAISGVGKSPAKWISGKDFRKGILAATMGSLWVLLLVMI